MCVSHFNFTKQTAGYLFPYPLFNRLFSGVKTLFVCLPFVWPYHLSKKKLSQIEYLHKFIETAMERVIFEKGKDNIEGVVPGLILAFCPSFEACISKALPWLNPFYDFSAFANFVSCI